MKYLMPFAATYFYEAGFTVLLKLKSKKRNKFEAEDAIEINLGRQCTYNTALRYAGGTTVALCITYSECSLRYSACNVYAPYGHL